MMYKLILGKFETKIDDEDKLKIMQNVDKNFIVLKSGEIVNPSFIQGIIIDKEATRIEKLPKQKVVIIEGKPTLIENLEDKKLLK